MSHNPHHPPDVMTIQSGSVEVFLPAHLNSRRLNGVRALRDADKEAYISVIRVEEPNSKVFTYGPTYKEHLKVEITYAYKGELYGPSSHDHS